MKKNKIILILLMMLVTASCQTVKNAVSGAKQENSDEFLVQKKNHLVLPPDFDDLPEPFDESTKSIDSINRINHRFTRIIRNRLTGPRACQILSI